jgi:hypothetical protein
MTVPPDPGRDPSTPPGAQGDPGGAYGARPEPEPLDFDPYRFGRPEHPVAPEYAPHGYRPPPSPAAPQYPYTPTPPPPLGYAPYGAPSSGNTKATIALVLGILAIVFSWTSVLDVVLIVPAIVLGVIGRNDAARFPHRGGRGAATSGLVCGLVAVVLAVAMTVYVYRLAKPCLDKYGSNPTSSAYQKCVSDRLLGQSR